MNIRTEVANRLNREIQRKAIRPDMVVRDTSISLEILTSYLAGQREIRFDELRPICNAIGLPMMRLFAPSFGEPKLQYRGATSQDRSRVSEIENSFLLIASALPKTKKFASPAIRDSESDIGMLLAEVNRAVETLRERYPNTEQLYDAANLPILTVDGGDEGFDAFLLSSDDRAIVCINRQKPTVRIHFSLLHEIAHFLFHRDRGVPVDTLTYFDLYNDQISSETKPEYIANKFAQMYLIPYGEAQSKASKWDRLGDISDYLIERRTAPDVLVNAIYDHLRLSQGHPPSYSTVKAAIAGAAQRYGAGTELREFIESRSAILRTMVRGLRDKFSDEVWADIAGSWEISDE